MVLEAVILCIDNSEYSRNGDYSPNRYDAMIESANLISAAKIQGNPETSVGILSMANHHVAVHVSLTRNNGAIMNSLAKDITQGNNTIRSLIFSLVCFEWKSTNLCLSLIMY
jgi:hypothetical protein